MIQRHISRIISSSVNLYGVKTIREVTTGNGKKQVRVDFNSSISTEYGWRNLTKTTFCRKGTAMGGNQGNYIIITSIRSRRKSR